MSQMKAQVDKLLTQASSGLFPVGFISEKILPEVKVAQYSGLLGGYGTSHLRIVNTVIGGRGKYRRVETQARTSQTFLIEGHGLEGMVSKADYKNVEDPYDAEKDEANGISTVLWLEKEKSLADTLTDTSIITQNVTLAGTDQFSDHQNSDPVGVVDTAKNQILDGCGTLKNLCACMDEKLYQKLKNHPQLLDSLGYKYARPGGLKGEELAQALGVDRIEISDVRYESAKENATSALLPVWGKSLVLLIAPPKAEKNQISAGYMVRLSDGSPRKVYKEAQFNPPGSTKILVEDEYDMLISNAKAAYVIKDAIA